jgi:hypothetical protein
MHFWASECSMNPQPQEMGILSTQGISGRVQENNIAAIDALF